jgi:ribosome-associated toxin RatA of RatAB toxin-antitoxin module
MYDLVADVGRYPEFLPWNAAARIRSRKPCEGGEVMEAIWSQLQGVPRTLRQPGDAVARRRIETEYLDGPFRYLKSHWHFTDLPGGGCEVDFHVDFEFRNAILQKIIGVVFNEAMHRIVRAFERGRRRCTADSPLPVAPDLSHDGRAEGRGHDRIPEIALDWHRAGRGAALATVVETWGSAPRPVGSQLAISGAGEIMGSVSGGCVEGAVVVEAQDALADGQPRLLTFGVSDDEAFAVGLACGGTIRVLVEPVGSALPEEVLAGVVAARAERRAVALVAGLQTGRGGWRTRREDDAPKRFRADRSGVEEGGEFIAIHNPPLADDRGGGRAYRPAAGAMARLAATTRC